MLEHTQHWDGATFLIGSISGTPSVHKHSVRPLISYTRRLSWMIPWPCLTGYWVWPLYGTGNMSRLLLKESGQLRLIPTMLIVMWLWAIRWSLLVGHKKA